MRCKKKYLDKIPALMDGYIVTEDILDAYVNKSLIGKEKKKSSKNRCFKRNK